MENAIKTGIKPQKKIIGLILAGGLAKRFGGGKYRAKLKGKPLITWVYEAISPFCAEIWLSWRKPPYEGPTLPFSRIIYDERPGAGPARALASVLKKFQIDVLFLVVPCDQPFLQPNLLKFLIQQISSFEAVLCLNEKGRPQPFPAVYKGGIPLKGNSFVQALKHLRVKKIPPSVWKHFDPKGTSFYNINYLNDLTEAEQILCQSSNFST